MHAYEPGRGDRLWGLWIFCPLHRNQFVVVVWAFTPQTLLSSLGAHGLFTRDDARDSCSWWARPRRSWLVRGTAGPDWLLGCTVVSSNEQHDGEEAEERLVQAAGADGVLFDREGLERSRGST